MLPNTIRSLTNGLIDQEWPSSDIWDARAGRYADRFLEVVAQGYTPALTDTQFCPARTQFCKNPLRQAYLEDIDTDYDGAQLPKNLAALDSDLLAFAERVAPQLHPS